MSILDTQNTYNLIGRMNNKTTVIEVDNHLSTESTNPVQNKVVTTAINEINETIANLQAYQPVVLADTTLTEAITTFDIDKYNGAAFSCNKFCVLLEVPSTETSLGIQVRVARETPVGTSLWILLADRISFVTTTDDTKHTLMGVIYNQNSNVYWESNYGCNEVELNRHWADGYSIINSNMLAGDASSLPEEGTQHISINAASSLIPVGTKITVWGYIKQ